MIFHVKITLKSKQLQELYIDAIHFTLRALLLIYRESITMIFSFRHTDTQAWTVIEMPLHLKYWVLFNFIDYFPACGFALKCKEYCNVFLYYACACIVNKLIYTFFNKYYISNISFFVVFLFIFHCHSKKNIYFFIFPTSFR